MTPRPHGDANSHGSDVPARMARSDCASNGDMDISREQEQVEHPHLDPIDTAPHSSTRDDDGTESTPPAHNDHSTPNGTTPSEDINMGDTYAGDLGPGETETSRTERPESPPGTENIPPGPVTDGSTIIHGEEESNTGNGAFDAQLQTPPSGKHRPRAKQD